jgi:AraC family transcriptional regulator, L-rhamnose operon regulatory protein RhaS
MIKYESMEGSIRINNMPFCVQHGELSRDFEVHSHLFHELVIIMEGTATHIIDGEEYSIKAGDVYVVGGETSHGFQDVRNLSLYNIMYYPDTLFPSGGIRMLPGFQALFVLEPQCRKEYGFQHRLQLSPGGRVYVREQIEIMQEEYEKRVTGCEAVLQSYFLALAAYLSREYVSAGGSFGSNDLMNLANAVAYMESHFMEPITLRLLSDFLSISTRHFIRIFQKHYASTPIDYLLRLRLEHSLELLKDSRWNITEVADKCGFADSNYFSRLFHKRFGLSPRGYRSMMNGQSRTPAL